MKKESLLKLKKSLFLLSLGGTIGLAGCTKISPNYSIEISESDIQANMDYTDEKILSYLDWSMKKIYDGEESALENGNIEYSEKKDCAIQYYRDTCRNYYSYLAALDTPGSYDEFYNTPDVYYQGYIDSFGIYKEYVSTYFNSCSYADYIENKLKEITLHE